MANHHEARSVHVGRLLARPGARISKAAPVRYYWPRRLWSPHPRGALRRMGYCCRARLCPIRPATLRDAPLHGTGAHATPARPAGCCDPYGTVIIIDLAGLSTHHLKHARAIAKVFITLARLDTAHYPDSLSCLFIVNAPTIFAVLAGLVRPACRGQPSTSSTWLGVSRMRSSRRPGGKCFPAPSAARDSASLPYLTRRLLKSHET